LEVCVVGAGSRKAIMSDRHREPDDEIEIGVTDDPDP